MRGIQAARASSEAWRPASRPDVKAQARWCPWPSRRTPPCPAEPAAKSPEMGEPARSRTRKAVSMRRPPSLKTIHDFAGPSAWNGPLLSGRQVLVIAEACIAIRDARGQHLRRHSQFRGQPIQRRGAGIDVGARAGIVGQIGIADAGSGRDGRRAKPRSGVAIVLSITIQACCPGWRPSNPRPLALVAEALALAIDQDRAFLEQSRRRREISGDEAQQHRPQPFRRKRAHGGEKPAGDEAMRRHPRDEARTGRREKADLRPPGQIAVDDLGADRLAHALPVAGTGRVDPVDIEQGTTHETLLVVPVGGTGHREARITPSRAEIRSDAPPGRADLDAGDAASLGAESPTGACVRSATPLARHARARWRI